MLNAATIFVIVLSLEHVKIFSVTLFAFRIWGETFEILSDKFSI